MTEWEKLCSGQLYNDFDEDLNRRRGLAKRCFRAYNRTQDENVPERQRLMRQLFGAVGEDVWIEPDFRCEYGCNIRLGSHVAICGKMMTSAVHRTTMARNGHIPLKISSRDTSDEATDFTEYTTMPRGGVSIPA